MKRKKNIIRQRNNLVPMPRMGRMKIVPVDVNGHDKPEAYPTLIKYLEANNRVRHMSHAQNYQARKLYLRGQSLSEIAKQTKLTASIIERLAVINGWEEERDKRLLAQFQRMNKIGGAQLAPSIDERHDRIAGTIEQIAERLLHKHQDEEQLLDIKDLNAISNVLKTTVDIRRTIRHKAGSKTTQEININHAMPESVDKLASIVSDALVSGKSRLNGTQNRQLLQVSAGESIGTDEEFENDRDQGT